MSTIINGRHDRLVPLANAEGPKTGSPWMISVGLLMLVSRCNVPWSGIPHSTIASSCASRAASLVGVSRPSRRSRTRPRNSIPFA